jgi:hypothetical protein
MSNWNIYKWNTSTLEWDSDSTIPRPNDVLPLERIHNQIRVQLAEGDNAYVTPEIKFLKQPVQLTWLFQDESLVTKLEGYYTNNDYLKIVTHVSGREWEGRFASFAPTWLIGTDGDKYDITGTFEIMA